MTEDGRRQSPGPERDAADASGYVVDEAAMGGVGLERVLARTVGGLRAGLVVIDDQVRIVLVNASAAAMLGYRPDDLVGERLVELMPERHRESFLDGVRAFLRSGDRTVDWGSVEFPGLRADGTEVPLTVSLSAFEAGDRQFFAGLFRAADDRGQREPTHGIEQAFLDSVLDALPDVVYAFDRDGRFLRWNDRLTAVTGYSDREVASMHPLEFVEPADTERVVDAIERVFESGATVVIEADVLTRSGRGIPYELTGAPLVDDGDIVGLTGVGRDISELRQRERQLERLNALNAVIRSVEEGLIEATTRAEVETEVCNRLATSASYVGAAIGSFDADRTAFTVSAAAGVDTSGFAVLLPETDRSIGASPAAEAVDEDTLRVVEVAGADEASWRRDARRQGYDHVAFVPIRTCDRTFGVMGVYASRQDGFQERERAILTDLGRVIGNAIEHALTRELLHADTVPEVEFETTDERLSMVALSGRLDCRIELDRTVPFGDEQVFYVTVTGATVEEVLAAVTEQPDIQSVSHLATSDGEHLFECTIDADSVATLVRGYGAQVKAAEADSGRARIVVQLPPDADVRHVVDAVLERFPQTEMIARREASRTVQTAHGFRRAVSEQLTAKQLAALQAAYVSGYFEWPTRTQSAADVAESLDIAPQTFHQHLRVAEAKVFRLLFECPAGVESA